MIKVFKSIIEDVDDKGIVTVAANAFGNIDAQKDISMPGSFNKTIKENWDRLKWYQNHNTNLLLGVPLEAKEVYPHLQVRGKINLEKEIGRDIYSDYKLYAEHGRSLEHSVGVDAKQHQMKGAIRHVSEWKWWEFSTLTSWGANPNTPLIEIKSDADLTETIDWFELRLKKGNFSDEKCLSIEAQIKKLRSLCLEPGNPTLKSQPNWEGWFK